MRPRGLALATLSAAVVWLFWPLIWGAMTGSPRFFEWDVPEQYWPDLVYLCDNLHAGRLPYWNPFDRAGYPYYADPQSAQYHPLNWAICAVAGPDPSPFWAELRVVLGFALAGLGGLAWLRGRDTPWLGAVPGAVLVMAAPFMRHNWELNLTQAMAALPWMLWAVDRLVDRPVLRNGAVFALVWASGAWVGSPPSLWFASSFTLLYGLWRLLDLSWERRLRVVATSVYAGVLGIGLIGAVLVPGLTLAQHSVQQDQSYASISDKALEWSELVALLWPQPGNHLYLGLFTLVAAVLATRTSTGRWAVGMGVLALGLTLGDHGPVFPLAWHVPGVSMFRLPHRYEAWLGPVGALCWAEASRVVQARGGAPGRLLGAWWAPSALGLLLLLDITRVMPPERHTRTHPHPGGDGAAVLAVAEGTDGPWRYYDEFGISCRSGTRLGRRDLRGYQDPLQLKQTERVWDALTRSPQLLAWFNVRWVLTGEHFIHGLDRRFVPLPEDLTAMGWPDRGAGVHEVPDALPRAWWTGTARRLADRRAALEWLESQPVGAGMVLDNAGTPDHPGPVDTNSGHGWVAADTHMPHPDRLEISVEAPERGWLVVNEAWYPGWRATVNGAPTPVWRANALVRAVPVPKGSSTVRLWFAPGDGWQWRWLLALSWLIALATLAGGGTAKYMSGRDRRNP